MRINEISLLYNVCLNKDIKKKEFKDFIVIETTECNYICDTANGICYKDNEIAIFSKKTEICELYVDNNELQFDLKIGNITYIKCYKKAILENSYNNYSDNLYEDYVEFGDKDNNHFFIRPKDNTIYPRDNYKIVNSKKVIDLFKKDQKIKTNKKIFLYLNFFIIEK